ncbi:hypothetical protein HDU76_010276 [Blyttiomyces sp. JEL0837]|nr:hypothetical protein HDU76_010276 [Blyttiomyces sp. JEL0837]
MRRSGTISSRPFSGIFGSGGSLSGSAPKGDIHDMLVDAMDESNMVPPIDKLTDCASLMDTTPTGPQDVIKSIFTALKTKKKHQAIDNALSALDFFVRRNDLRFIQEFTRRENFQFLEKQQASMSIAWSTANKDRLLGMIAEWADLIQDPPEIRMFYNNLVGKGYYNRVPELMIGVRNRNVPFGVGGVPILRSATSYGQQNMIMYQVPSSGPGVSTVYLNPVHTAPVPMPLQMQMQMQAVGAPSIRQVSGQERKNWVEFDCKVAENTVSAFLEAVKACKPEELRGNEIVQEFLVKCQEMDRRLVSLLGQVEEDDLVVDLVSSRTTVTDAMEEYEKLVSGASLRTPLVPIPAPTTTTTSTSSAVGYANLLDFDDPFQSPEERRQSVDQKREQQQVPPHDEHDDNKPIAELLVVGGGRNSKREVDDDAEDEDPFGDDKEEKELLAKGGPVLPMPWEHK